MWSLRNAEHGIKYDYVLSLKTVMNKSIFLGNHHQAINKATSKKGSKIEQISFEIRVLLVMIETAEMSILMWSAFIR